MHLVKALLCILFLVVANAQSAPTLNSLSSYKTELTTAALVTAGTAGWIASSYLARLLKDPASAYERAAKEFNRLSKQEIASKNSIKAHQDLQNKLANLQNNNQETVHAFNRLIVLHGLYDAETQKRAWHYLDERMWAATGKLGAYFVGGATTGRYIGPDSVGGERDLTYENGLFFESILSTKIVEPPAQIISGLYSKYFTNEQKIQEQKEKVLALAQSFKELIEKQIELVAFIKRVLEEIEASPEYIAEVATVAAAKASLPWWKRIFRK